MGEGPLYPFWIPYHLVHFEAPNAIARVALFGDSVAPPLGGPVVEVCAVAKRDLKAGEVLDEYGMYMTYGEAVRVDEMSACATSRGPRRGLYASARHRAGRGAQLRRRRAARRTAWPTGSAPSSTGTSAARRGSRTCSPGRRRSSRDSRPRMSASKAVSGATPEYAHADPRVHAASCPVRRASMTERP